MAVMKTFCGCSSTRSGTVAILLLYLACFTAAGVFSVLWLSSSELETDFKLEWGKVSKECEGSNLADEWWCQLLRDNDPQVEPVLIAAIVVAAIFNIVSAVGLVGASRLSPFLLVPWLIVDFLVWLLLAVVVGYAFVTLIGFEKTADEEATEAMRDDIIALGVTGAINVALLLYLWVCVFSYYQALRYFEQLEEEEVKPLHPYPMPIFEHGMDNEEFFDSEEADNDTRHDHSTTVEYLDDDENNNKNKNKEQSIDHDDKINHI